MAMKRQSKNKSAQNAGNSGAQLSFAGFDPEPPPAPVPPPTAKSIDTYVAPCADETLPPLSGKLVVIVDSHSLI